MTDEILSNCCYYPVKICVGKNMYEQNQVTFIERGRTYFYWCPKCEKACDEMVNNE